jgi:hypothetical protein
MILYGEQDIREMLYIYFRKNESKTATAEDELDFFSCSRHKWPGLHVPLSPRFGQSLTYDKLLLLNLIYD